MEGKRRKIKGIITKENKKWGGRGSIPDEVDI
jgi:hypothetical protein